MVARLEARLVALDARLEAKLVARLVAPDPLLRPRRCCARLGHSSGPGVGVANGTLPMQPVSME